MRSKAFTPTVYVAFAIITVVVMAVCIMLGSASVPLDKLVQTFFSAAFGWARPEGSAYSIIMDIRLPRVLSAGLVGGALSLAGCAMQGLLKNPLADGSTLGVSAGASLGAVLAITFGLSIPFLPLAGTTIGAALFALLSLLTILALAHRLDRSLSTDTIILIGIIFGMFVSALMSILITFAGERAMTIVFWTMGSLQNSSYQSVLLLTVVTVVFGAVLMSLSRELNAFAIGEDNARHIGVNVRRVKLLVLVCVSALIGTCVSVGGIIGFVGLVTPHMIRRITGPNHSLLMPASIFGGAVFLMLSDLVARMMFSPRELNIGVITSIVGAFLFINIFSRTRRVTR
ncbi:MAG: iron ABC transporter permease [Coriobacteriales bacterium]|jgi:iron complex transport system permease protein|nr:iron ABC transporter permease [Coriobacteriales bacterium]